MGLDSMGPLMHRFFPNKYISQYNMILVESADEEPQIQRANSKIIPGFSTVFRVNAPNPSIVQGSTVYIIHTQNLRHMGRGYVLHLHTHTE